MSALTPAAPAAARLRDTLAWTAAGTELFLGAVATLDEASYAGPSALPGWTRAHVVAHVSANADAVGRLVQWARTGVPTPMYSSPDQRRSDIEDGARRPPAELAAWAAESAADLAAAMAVLSDEQWQVEVVTAQGRHVPAAETPWMRAREVWVHCVDLAAGPTMADLPPDLLGALVDDITRKRATGDGPALSLTATDTAATWQVSGSGAPVEVTGRLCDLAGWLAGRPHGRLETPGRHALVDLPPWL